PRSKRSKPPFSGHAAPHRRYADASSWRVFSPSRRTSENRPEGSTQATPASYEASPSTSPSRPDSFSWPPRPRPLPRRLGLTTAHGRVRPELAHASRVMALPISPATENVVPLAWRSPSLSSVTLTRVCTYPSMG